MKKRKKLTGAILIVGTSRQSPDLLYRTHFVTPDPVVYLEGGTARYLVVSRMELGRAKQTVRGIVVLTPEELQLADDERRRLSGWARALLRRVHRRRVMVPGQFPFGVAQRLQRAGVRVETAEGPLFPRRAIKQPAELRAIRIAQRAAAAGVRAARRLIRAARVDRHGRLVLAGRVLTAEAVRRAIHRTLLEFDCTGTETIVAGGRQAADPHQRGSGPLRAGEAIVIDVFPQHEPSGYWGDITRTCIKGTPSPELRRLVATVQRAQTAALRTLHAGVPLARPQRAAVDIMTRAGFKNGMERGRPCGFIHGLGHGVGLEIHEAPAVGARQGRLRAGQVVTVEPGLYYPRLGGARIEDTVVVTDRGWRYLATCSKTVVIP